MLSKIHSIMLKLKSKALALFVNRSFWDVQTVEKIIYFFFAFCHNGHYLFLMLRNEKYSFFRTRNKNYLFSECHIMAIIFSEPLVMRLFESLMAIDVNIRKFCRFSVLKNEKQKFPIIFEHPWFHQFVNARSHCVSFLSYLHNGSVRKKATQCDCEILWHHGQAMVSQTT